MHRDVSTLNVIANDPQTHHHSTRSCRVTSAIAVLTASKLGHVYQCVGCESLALQPVGRIVETEKCVRFDCLVTALPLVPFSAVCYVSVLLLAAYLALACDGA